MLFWVSYRCDVYQSLCCFGSVTGVMFTNPYVVLGVTGVTFTNPYVVLGQLQV